MSKQAEIILIILALVAMVAMIMTRGKHGLQAQGLPMAKENTETLIAVGDRIVGDSNVVQNSLSRAELSNTRFLIKGCLPGLPPLRRANIGVESVGRPMKAMQGGI